MEKKVVDNKITSLIYKNQNLEFMIPVKSFCVRRKSDTSNPGTILEEYRSLRQRGETESAAIYLRDHCGEIETYISRCANPEQGLPDYVQVFNTSDGDRNAIIECFTEKMLEGRFADTPVPNYSRHFSKVNREFSVLVDQGTIEEKSRNFTYQRPNNLTLIERLWIVDDIIDTGATIEIFLNALMAEGLLTQETQINVFILYNNFLADTAFKGITKENLIQRLNE